MATSLSPKEDYNYNAIDGRKAVVARGIGYMKQYPAFGLGIDNFAGAERTISPKIASLRTNCPMRGTPPHNSCLEAGSDCLSKSCAGLACKTERLARSPNGPNAAEE
jgi:hypothetical protein